VPLPRNFLEFLYQNFRAFWVAISYRLVVLPESEIRLKLKFTGDRSSILGTRPIIIPSGELRAKKMTKMHQKSTKGNCGKITLFLFSYISVFILLNYFEGGGLGGMAPNSPLTTPLCRPHAVLIFDHSQCLYRAMHFSAKRGLAIACRPSVRRSVKMQSRTLTQAMTCSTRSSSALPRKCQMSRHFTALLNSALYIKC